jgi:hypothetical protein
VFNTTYDYTTGYLTVFTASVWTFSATQSLTFTINNLYDVEKIAQFTYISGSSSEYRYFQTEYRISPDGSNWSSWLELKKKPTNFPSWDSKDTLNFQVKFTRTGESEAYLLYLESFNIKFSIERNLISDDSEAFLNSSNNTVIIKPPYIYKVFKLDHFETITSGDSDNLSVKWRYSQDYGKSTTNWEPLTRENIKTARINPIRFFQVEYLLEYTGTDWVKVWDINLIGDFQNVTEDSKKTNILALRQDCTCLKLELVGGKPATTGQLQSEMLNKTCSSSGLYKLTDEDKAKLYKPYELNPLLSFWQKMASDTNQIFGHEIYYFLTDPDKNGIDHTFHEYQLYNYVCDGLIKVSVEQNKFPEDTMMINQFDLSLFDSFEIHIIKEDFKKLFGVEKRPAKEDFIWFCQINKMFIVEHVREFRQINNAAVYWKVMLKKYSQAANVTALNQDLQEKVERLTRNSTIEELFGVELEEDKKSTANRPEFKTLSQDPVRLEVRSRIEKELIENSTFIISKSHYQMNSIVRGSDAVVYNNIQNVFTKGQNISYFAWLNFNTIPGTMSNNLFTYYNSAASEGIKIDINSSNALVTLNSTTYSLPVSSITTDVWYCYLVNIDQRQRKIQQYLYKRNVDVEDEAKFLPSITLKKLFSNELDLTSQFIEIESESAQILASDMKLTNIRLFSDVISESDHSELLTLAKVGNDARFLIFADNANTRITLPYRPFQ